MINTRTRTHATNIPSDDEFCEISHAFASRLLLCQREKKNDDTAIKTLFSTWQSPQTTEEWQSNNRYPKCHHFQLNFELTQKNRWNSVEFRIHKKSFQFCLLNNHGDVNTNCGGIKKTLRIFSTRSNVNIKFLMSTKMFTAHRTDSNFNSFLLIIFLLCFVFCFTLHCISFHTLPCHALPCLSFALPLSCLAALLHCLDLPRFT